MFLSEKTPLVAIDIGTYSIKLAVLRGSSGKFELENFAVMPLEYEAIVDGEIKNEAAVIDALSRLVKAEGIKTRFAVSSVSGEAVIIKKIRLPVMSREAAVEKIRSEAEQYIPFDIEDVNMDFHILGSVAKKNGQPAAGEEPQMDVLLVAVQKETIESRIGVLSEAGLKPVIVDLDVFALMNAVSLCANLESMGGLALIDLGASFTHINVLHNGISYFTRDFPVGGQESTDKLMTEFKITLAEANAFKQGKMPDKVDRERVSQIIRDSFGPIIEEIRNSFEGFAETTGKRVEQVLISGGGALVNGVEDLLMDSLGLPVGTANPLKAIKVDAKKFDRACIAEFAPVAVVALGLAMRKFDYK